MMNRLSSITSKTTPLIRATAVGALTGLVCAGFGSRLVMRLIAVMNPSHDGVMTDSSATVGEVSLGGTIGLLVLGAVLGVLGGLLYLGLRRWLWVSGSWRGPVFGLLTIATVGQPLFDPANVDFQIFEPVVLVVALFASLFIINGVVLTSALDRVHPEPAYRGGVRVPRAVAGALVVVGVLGLLLFVGSFTTMIDDAGTCYSAAGGGEGCAVRESNAPP